MDDDNKVREAEARRAAEQRHLWLRKTLVRRGAPWFVLVDMASSRLVEGPFKLEQVENWLNDDHEASA